jgi:hypothetical protein
MDRAPSAFISHADEDAEVAFELCRHLEQAGIACWIAPRDVTPGQDYGSEIVVGIESCSAFVLILSAEANRSAFVRREVERAASKGKPMFPVRIEDVLPERALEFFISSSHWIDARQAPRTAQWQRIARAIKGEREAPGTPGSAGSISATGRPRWNGRRTAIAVGCGALGLGLLGGLWLMRAGDGGPPPDADRSHAQITVPAEPPPGERAAAAPDSRPPAVPPVRDAEPVRIAGPSGPCPQSLSADRDLPTPFTCDCIASQTRDGAVWGTDLYTDDSDLCRAALHAGAIPPAGGRITVMREAGRDLYVGSLRHGVRSSDYGAFAASLRFAGVAVPSEREQRCPASFAINPDLPTPFSCVCDADATRDGAVWGSDVYTADSALCRAARHAGAIPAEGGRITVERVAGRDLYAGTARHGVRSSDYGAYPAGIRFAGTPQPPVPAPCPNSLSINPDLATPYTCACSSEAVREGTVWGSGPYTADSAICRAALHAGKLTAAGGTVTLEFGDGRDVYAGSRRNGVATHDYGAYPSSIAFR